MGNKACARMPLVIGGVQLVDEACGDTSAHEHLGRGERALVGTACLGIEIRMF